MDELFGPKDVELKDVLLIYISTAFRFIFQKRGPGGPPFVNFMAGIPLMAPGGAAFASPAVMAAPPKIRTEFPETWLFESVPDSG